MLCRDQVGTVHGRDSGAVMHHQNQNHSLDRLSALPDDILAQIFELVGRFSRRQLVNVSRLNQRAHAIVDRILYKDIILFGAPQHHVVFAESLRRRPRRASLITTVALVFAPPSPPSPPPLSPTSLSPVGAGDAVPAHVHMTVSPALSAMSNLQTLTVDVPDTLLHSIGSLFNGPFDLPSLTRCSLNYRTADKKACRFWDLRENIHVFASPTIETLTVRGARLDHRGFGEFMERPHQTPLRTLHFVDCDLSDDGLTDLLAFPTALEEFVLVAHDCDPDDGSEVELEETADNIGYYVSALDAQRHALRHVTLDLPAPQVTGRRALRMRDYARLETLRLGWDYHLFGRTGKKPRMHSVAFPPKIRTVEFLNELGTDEQVTELLEAAIMIRDVLARDWERLIVPEGDEQVLGLIKRACREVGLGLTIIGQGDLEGDADSRDEELEAENRNPGGATETNREGGLTIKDQILLDGGHPEALHLDRHVLGSAVA
ncbi:hypothetical protein P8C59_002975 [Phyllachora maydis]|uniref:F-box domain-containing protein n=1 Tax=Phyllachora maydis TaxID=1825666 RepID=A0AAD9HZB1_9PEZI|nr:hypothetical protein P8C59_002975 [Phyllachora maydis]